MGGTGQRDRKKSRVSSDADADDAARRQTKREKKVLAQQALLLAKTGAQAAALAVRLAKQTQKITKQREKLAAQERLALAVVTSDFPELPEATEERVMMTRFLTGRRFWGMLFLGAEKSPPDFEERLRHHFAEFWTDCEGEQEFEIVSNDSSQSFRKYVLLDEAWHLATQLREKAVVENSLTHSYVIVAQKSAGKILVCGKCVVSAARIDITANWGEVKNNGNAARDFWQMSREKHGQILFGEIATKSSKTVVCKKSGNLKEKKIAENNRPCLKKKQLRKLAYLICKFGEKKNAEFEFEFVRREKNEKKLRLVVTKID